MGNPAGSACGGVAARGDTTTIEAANAFLPVYLERHNERFAVAASDPLAAWRPWPDGLDAASVFCFHYRRRVARDNTASWLGGGLALPRRVDGRSWAGRAVIIEERLDGSLWVRHERSVQVTSAPASVGQLRARDLRPLRDGVLVTPSPRPDGPPRPATRSTSRPRPDHPWYRGYAQRRIEGR